MIVFDVTNVMSLAHTAQWLEEAKDANQNYEPLIFLVGTKRDLLVSYKEFLMFLELLVSLSEDQMIKNLCLTVTQGISYLSSSERLTSPKSKPIIYR